MKNKKILLISVSSIFIVDQLTKILVNLFIPLNKSKDIISNFLNITNIHNYGAAFGSMNNMRWFIVLISILILFLLIREYEKYKNKKIMIITFALIIGGLLGNLIDRIFLGYVRDFIDFTIFGNNLAIFNCSDACIVIGTLMLLVLAITMEGNNEKNKNKEE